MDILFNIMKFKSLLLKEKNYLRWLKQRFKDHFSKNESEEVTQKKTLLNLSQSVFSSSLSYFIQSRMDLDQYSLWKNPDFLKSTGGFLPEENFKSNNILREIVHLDTFDHTRANMLILLLRTVIENKIKGDIAELGVYQGHTAKLFHYYCPEKKLYLFDTFNGFEKADLTQENDQIKNSESIHEFKDTNKDDVLNFICPKNQNVKIIEGYFPKSIPNELFGKTYSFVHLDADLYVPTKEGLRFFYPRVSEGGMIVCHDYNAWPGVRKAVDEFLKDKKEFAIPMPDKSGSAIILKY